MIAQVIGFLPPKWENWIKFLALTLALAESWLLHAFEELAVDEGSLSHT